MAWFIFPEGMVSIVLKDDDVENDILCVRSRDRVSLDAYCAYAEVRPQVSENAGTDYPLRVYLTREQVHKAQAAIVDRITYANFKEESKSVRDDDTFTEFLTRVWVAGLSLEEGEDYVY